MSIEELKNELLPKYQAFGDDKFYKYIIMLSVNKILLMHKGTYKGQMPNIELLGHHDQFMSLYRREGDPIYLKIAFLLRKAANKIYRVLRKNNLVPFDNRFLNSM